MADIVQGSTGFSIKYHDNGDGTYAPYMASIGSASAPVGTTLNTYEGQLSTNATTSVTASTAYIESIVIVVVTGGTTSSITIQDGQGTPLKIINALATTTASTTPTIVSLQSPVKMTSGISIVTAGAAAATVDVWISYYQ